MTPEQAAKQRAERRAAGLCVTCGQRPPGHGHTTCENCRRYFRDRAKLGAAEVGKRLYDSEFRQLTPHQRMEAMERDGLEECAPCGALLWRDRRDGPHECPGAPSAVRMAERRPPPVAVVEGIGAGDRRFF